MPQIEVEGSKLVTVKQDYQGKSKPDVKPHRISATLKVQEEFDGKGEFTWSPQILVFGQKARRRKAKDRSKSDLSGRSEEGIYNLYTRGQTKPERREEPNQH